MVVRLFTYWPSWSSKERTEEFEACLATNLENPLIDEITVLVDKPLQLDDFYSNVVWVAIGKKEPTYDMIIAMANAEASENDVTIIANGDIFFDDSLAKIRSLTHDKCFALSRWNLNSSGEIELYDRIDSQDCWIFRGKIDGIVGNFPVGALGCDNRIAYEIEKAGYIITNPCKSIVTTHVHLVPFRQAVKRTAVPKPYKYLDTSYLRPFMSIVTRKHPNRPVMFQQNLDSVNIQTDQDFEHIILRDDVGIGSAKANMMFYWNRDQVSGDYVFMLDDDDVLTEPTFVEDMKKIVASGDYDVIMIRMILNGELYPTSTVWKKQPVKNHIGTSNFIIKNSIWKDHIRNFLPMQTGDYNFIKTVFESKPSVIWVDKIYSKTLRVSCGLPE